MEIKDRLLQLRREKGMTQAELAERLGISRQAVSRWETGEALPSTENLVDLRRIYGVSLDSILGLDAGQDADTQPQPDAVVERVIIRETVGGRRIAGIVLLGLGALVFLLFTLMAQLAAGLIFCTPFVVCGVICLCCKRNAGLWCAWALVLLVSAYLAWATGVRWTLIYLTLIYEWSWNYMRLAIAWAMLAAYVALIFATVLRFRKKTLEPTRRSVGLTALCWVLFGLCFVPFNIDPLSGLATVVYVALDLVKLVTFTAALSLTVRIVGGWRANKAG